jgi:hypothetical protein
MANRVRQLLLNEEQEPKPRNNGHYAEIGAFKQTAENVDNRQEAEAHRKRAKAVNGAGSSKGRASSGSSRFH